METNVISTKEIPDFGQTFNSFTYLLKKDMSKKLTTAEFIKKSQDIHKEKYDYSKVEYVSNNVKVKIICPTHGEFLQRPNDHVSKKVGCPACSGRGRTSEQFISELKKVHGNEYDYSKVIYTGIDNEIIISCKSHGDFLQSAYTHIKGSGCPKCKGEKMSNRQLSTLSYFIERAQKIHGEKYDYSLVDYKKGTMKVQIKCKQHGIFEQIPDSHLQGRGCPSCSESKGEKMISKILSDLNIDYLREKKFEDCKGKVHKLPFDFYLPDYNICIEYDGEQHFKLKNNSFGAGEEKSKINFEKLVQNDKIKNEYCVNNNILLIRIRYDENILNVENKIKEQVYGRN